MLDAITRLTLARNALDRAIASLAESQHQAMMSEAVPKVALATGAEQLRVASGNAAAAGPPPANAGDKHLLAAKQHANNGWHSFNTAVGHIQTFMAETKAAREEVLEKPGELAAS